MEPSGIAMHRCYDPRRMSSAPPRTLAILGRALRAIAWTAVLVVLAASAAGLTGQFWHPPGSDARAELTYAGDTAMKVRLDAASTQLTAIAADIERLAGEAKTALEEVASPDSTRLQDSLQRGGQAAAAIDLETQALRESLAGLPGDGPAAEIDYSNATLVRRAAVLAAIDAAGSVAGQWQSVTGRATDAAHLTSLIDQHNRAMIDATNRGRDRKYAEANTFIDSALLTVDQVVAVRKRIITSTDRTVLDEWVDRNRTWDIALKALYSRSSSRRAPTRSRSSRLTARSSSPGRSCRRTTARSSSSWRRSPAAGSPRPFSRSRRRTARSTRRSRIRREQSAAAP